MALNFKLNTDKYLSKCDSKDVISFDNKEGKQWVDVNRLMCCIINVFRNYGICCISQHAHTFQSISTWFNDGEECEILRAGSSGWQKGKIKINVTLEFIPDEPEPEESPLDDIRQAEINNM